MPTNLFLGTDYRNMIHRFIACCNIGLISFSFLSYLAKINYELLPPFLSAALLIIILAGLIIYLEKNPLVRIVCWTILGCLILGGLIQWT